ncbi:3-oxoacyl-[acyl-carrier protein] reductase [Nocardioides cavernae]|uniref:3-oxoacyl-[acyl-carrier protein] reductase n=1 Tax=Nocardioides cavernae TaxID=1921566 RepID=A0A7Y9H0N3_9ACTN|nr:SDR family oxidoreductase [Nocardioides cavernae]NYE35809.1 3-oxoacyl-[acyl-carrier protein] reductase [Nocardioides cavernae]
MSRDGDRTGAVAVVTGAGSGLGRAFAELWLERHGPVVGLDLEPDRIAWLDERPDAAGVPGDVTDPEANAVMVRTAEERFGRVDAAVLAAGISAWGRVEELGLDVYDRVMDVNVRGVVHGIRAAAPALRRAGGGAVVVLSSTSASAGEPDHWAYCTSKAAVTNLARSAAMDLAPDGIRVNVVAPGPTHTELTRPIRETDPDKYHQLRVNMPMQRWGEQDEVAEAIAFLAGPASSFVTAAVLPVDGGMTGRTPQLPALPLTT